MSWAHCSGYSVHCQQFVSISRRGSEIETGHSNMERAIVEWMQTNLYYKQNRIWQNNKHECVWFFFLLLMIRRKKVSGNKYWKFFLVAVVAVAFYVHYECFFYEVLCLISDWKYFDGLTSTMKIASLSVDIAQKCYKVIYAISIRVFSVPTGGCRQKNKHVRDRI